MPTTVERETIVGLGNSATWVNGAGLGKLKSGNLGNGGIAPHGLVISEQPLGGTIVVNNPADKVESSGGTVAGNGVLVGPPGVLVGIGVFVLVAVLTVGVGVRVYVGDGPNVLLAKGVFVFDGVKLGNRVLVIVGVTPAAIVFVGRGVLVGEGSDVGVFVAVGNGVLDAPGVLLGTAVGVRVNNVSI